MKTKDNYDVREGMWLEQFKGNADTVKAITCVYHEEKFATYDEYEWNEEDETYNRTGSGLLDEDEISTQYVFCM